MTDEQKAAATAYDAALAAYDAAYDAACDAYATAQWHSDDSCPKCLGNPCECSRKETQS